MKKTASVSFSPASAPLSRERGAVLFMSFNLAAGGTQEKLR